MSDDKKPWDEDPMDAGIVWLTPESFDAFVEDLDKEPDPEAVEKLRQLFEKYPDLDARKLAVEAAAKEVEKVWQDNKAELLDIDAHVSSLSVSEELPSIEEVKDALHIFIITTKTFPEVESHDDEIAIQIMKAYVDGRLVEKE